MDRTFGNAESPSPSCGVFRALFESTSVKLNDKLGDRLATEGLTSLDAATTSTTTSSVYCLVQSRRWFSENVLANFRRNNDRGFAVLAARKVTSPPRPATMQARCADASRKNVDDFRNSNCCYSKARRDHETRRDQHALSFR